MSNLYNEIFELTRECPHICYVYGAGKLARLIKNTIEEKGGSIAAFVVDDEFYDRENDIIERTRVMPISCVKSLQDYKIIIGFEGGVKNKIYEYGIDINRVYAADFLGYLATGGEEFQSYYKSHIFDFSATRNMLSDLRSMEAFDLFLNQRIYGTYEKKYEHNSQYFDKNIIGNELSENEVFVDCGAFQGETARDFVSFLGENGIDKYRKIIEIEPDTDNANTIRNNLKELKNIEIIQAGVYDKSGTLLFESGNLSASKISENGDLRINVISIDEEIGNRVDVTFIKMDIEGSELKALTGAYNTIKRCHPKLAICVYHKAEDLIEIPKFIKSISEDYKLFLRNYSRCGVETVLYAV